MNVKIGEVRSRRLGPIVRAYTVEFNFWLIILVAALCIASVAGAAVFAGRHGVAILAGWFVGPIIGLALGLIWPVFRRAVIRSGGTLEVGEYFTFAGSRFPLRVLDGPTTYQPQELIFQVVGDLEVPGFLAEAQSHMRERLTTYRGPRVLFDGQCFALSGPPLIRRTWSNVRERPTIVADFRRTSYFIRVLCRQAMDRDLQRHIETGWPAEVPKIGDLRRQVVSLADDFSPFLHPGAGINVCLVAYDRVGRPWTLVQRRGSGIAEDTGPWATSLHEGFAGDDVTADSMIDPFLTAQRAAREELGISLTKIEFFVVAMDEGSLPGQPVTRSGGFEVIGLAETSLPAERLGDTRFRGRDKFESAEFVALELNASSVFKLLSEHPPEQWFSPALVAVVETLERLRPGSWNELSARLETARPELSTR
jgi:8-oxo-dGTP pyrophosphatase MutT (NUDIX family)